jgi:TPR repeat protein
MQLQISGSQENTLNRAIHNTPVSSSSSSALVDKTMGVFSSTQALAEVEKPGSRPQQRVVHSAYWYEHVDKAYCHWSPWYQPIEIVSKIAKKINEGNWEEINDFTLNDIDALPSFFFKVIYEPDWGRLQIDRHTLFQMHMAAGKMMNIIIRESRKPENNEYRLNRYNPRTQADVLEQCIKAASIGINLPLSREDAERLDHLCIYLGNFYSNHESLKEKTSQELINSNAAFYWYSVAAQSRDSEEGMIRLGELLEGENTGFKDLTAAFEWYKKAAAKGNPRWTAFLAEKYLQHEAIVGKAPSSPAADVQEVLPGWNLDLQLSEVERKLYDTYTNMDNIHEFYKIFKAVFENSKNIHKERHLPTLEKKLKAMMDVMVKCAYEGDTQAICALVEIINLNGYGNQRGIFSSVSYRDLILCKFDKPQLDLMTSLFTCILEKENLNKQFRVKLNIALGQISEYLPKIAGDVEEALTYYTKAIHLSMEGVKTKAHSPHDTYAYDELILHVGYLYEHKFYRKEASFAASLYWFAYSAQVRGNAKGMMCLGNLLCVRFYNDDGKRYYNNYDAANSWFNNVIEMRHYDTIFDREFPLKLARVVIKEPNVLNSDHVVRDRCATILCDMQQECCGKEEAESVHKKVKEICDKVSLKEREYHVSFVVPKIDRHLM